MDVHVDDADLGLGDAPQRVAEDPRHPQHRLPREARIACGLEHVEDLDV